MNGEERITQLKKLIKFCEEEIDELEDEIGRLEMDLMEESYQLKKYEEELKELMDNE